MTASEFAKKFFDYHIRYYGAPQKLIMDRGSNFLGDVSKELYNVTSLPICLVSAAHPAANKAEAAVGRFSRALKTVLAGSNILQWKEKLPIIQIVVNASLIHPISGRSPFELSGCSPYSAIYSPLVLFKTDQEKHLSKLWQDKVALMRAITTQLQSHHKVHLGILRNPAATAAAMNLKKGSKCFYRIHGHTHMAPGLSPLLPKWSTATVEEIPGKSSFLLRSDVTGRLISRHISDVHPAPPANRFGPTDNAEDGFNRYLLETGGAMQEFEQTDQQMKLGQGQQRANVKMEEHTRKNFEEYDGAFKVDGRQNEMPKVDAKSGAVPKQEPRKSRRIRGLAPE